MTDICHEAAALREGGAQVLEAASICNPFTYTSALPFPVIITLLLLCLRRVLFFFFFGIANMSAERRLQIGLPPVKRRCLTAPVIACIYDLNEVLDVEFRIT